MADALEITAITEANALTPTEKQWSELVNDPLSLVMSKKVWSRGNTLAVCSQLLESYSRTRIETPEQFKFLVLHQRVFNPLLLADPSHHLAPEALAKLLNKIDTDMGGSLTRLQSQLETHDTQHQGMFKTYLVGLISSFTQKSGDVDISDYIQYWNNEIAPMFPLEDKSHVCFSQELVEKVRDSLIDYQNNPILPTVDNGTGHWKTLVENHPVEVVDYKKTVEFVRQKDLVDKYLDVFESLILTTNFIKANVLWTPEARLKIREQIDQQALANPQATAQRLSALVARRPEIIKKGNQQGIDWQGDSLEEWFGQFENM